MAYRHRCRHPCRCRALPRPHRTKLKFSWCTTDNGHRQRCRTCSLYAQPSGSSANEASQGSASCRRSWSVLSYFTAATGSTSQRPAVWFHRQRTARSRSSWDLTGGPLQHFVRIVLVFCCDRSSWTRQSRRSDRNENKTSETVRTVPIGRSSRWLSAFSFAVALPAAVGRRSVKRMLSHKIRKAKTKTGTLPLLRKDPKPVQLLFTSAGVPWAR